MLEISARFAVIDATPQLPSHAPADAGDLKRQFRKLRERGMLLSEGHVWFFFSQIAGASRDVLTVCVNYPTTAHATVCHRTNMSIIALATYLIRHNLVDAVEYMHSRRLMHRDIKPANVFLTVEGVIKLGDLGMSHLLSESTPRADSVVGSPLWLAPEVCSGRGFEFSSEVWSLGCLLYELITLRHPFRSGPSDGSLYSLFKRITTGAFAPLPAELASPSLRDLVGRMLQLDPSLRPNMTEVRDIARRMHAASAYAYEALGRVSPNSLECAASGLSSSALHAPACVHKVSDVVIPLTARTDDAVAMTARSSSRSPAIGTPLGDTEDDRGGHSVPRATDPPSPLFEHCEPLSAALAVECRGDDETNAVRTPSPPPLAPALLSVIDGFARVYPSSAKDVDSASTTLPLGCVGDPVAPSRPTSRLVASMREVTTTHAQPTSPGDVTGDCLNVTSSVADVNARTAASAFRSPLNDANAALLIPHAAPLTGKISQGVHGSAPSKKHQRRGLSSMSGAAHHELPWPAPRSSNQLAVGYNAPVLAFPVIAPRPLQRQVTPKRRSPEVWFDLALSSPLEAARVLADQLRAANILRASLPPRLEVGEQQRGDSTLDRATAIAVAGRLVFAMPPEALRGAASSGAEAVTGGPFGALLRVARACMVALGADRAASATASIHDRFVEGTVSATAAAAELQALLIAPPLQAPATAFGAAAVLPAALATGWGTASLATLLWLADAAAESASVSAQPSGITIVPFTAADDVVDDSRADDAISDVVNGDGDNDGVHQVNVNQLVDPTEWRAESQRARASLLELDRSFAARAPPFGSTTAGLADPLSGGSHATLGGVDWRARLAKLQEHIAFANGRVDSGTTMQANQGAAPSAATVPNAAAPSVAARAAAAASDVARRCRTVLEATAMAESRWNRSAAGGSRVSEASVPAGRRAAAATSATAGQPPPDTDSVASLIAQHKTLASRQRELRADVEARRTRISELEASYTQLGENLEVVSEELEIRAARLSSTSQLQAIRAALSELRRDARQLDVVMGVCQQQLTHRRDAAMMTNAAARSVSSSDHERRERAVATASSSTATGARRPNSDVTAN